VAHVSGAAPIAKAAPAAAAARPPAALGRSQASGLARRAAARVGNLWLPRLAWNIGRTGRPGLLGIALLLAAALFLVTTHLRVSDEVEAMAAELASAPGRAPTAVADRVADPVAGLRALPARAEMPAILGQLFGNASRAHLAVNTAKYEIYAIQTSSLVRHQIAFPVTGSYPQIRAFIDTTLATMPAVSLTGLVLERKSIAHGNVEAEIRLNVYTRSDP
jgi:hypothetical protein